MSGYRLHIGLDEDQTKRLVKELRESARVDYDRRVGLDSLSPEHHRIFVHALKNVISTELAVFTFAQLVGGLPVADVAWERRGHDLCGVHPLDKHEELCPGTMEKARELRESFDTKTLKFNQKLGAMVYKMNLRLHDGDVDSVVNWSMPPDLWDNVWEVPKPPPTLFNLPHYMADDIYPEGAADMTGYWTEDRILGGVIMFNRRAEANTTDDTAMPNVSIHSCRVKVTNRITQLRDDQHNALLAFFFAADSPPPESCPLPVLPDKQNRIRIDVHEATLHHRVYRDVWERRPLSLREIEYLVRRPRAEVDYPEMRTLVEQLNDNSRYPATQVELYRDARPPPPGEHSPRGNVMQICVPSFVAGDILANTDSPTAGGQATDETPPNPSSK